MSDSNSNGSKIEESGIIAIGEISPDEEIIFVEEDAQPEEDAPKRGFTREEIRFQLELARELSFDGDTVKEGNLPADVIPRFNLKKLANMLELDPSTRKECWAMHRLPEARKGMSFKLAAQVFDTLSTRLDDLDRRRKAALEEITSLKLDPSRVDGMTVAAIEAKLNAYKAEREAERQARRDAGYSELMTLLKIVNQLEQREGLELSALKGVDQKTLSKAEFEHVRKQLLGRKGEIEGHLRQSLAGPLKKAANKAA